MTRSFDVKWSRDSEPKLILKCTGLTETQMVARIINVLRNKDKVIIHSVKKVNNGNAL